MIKRCDHPGCSKAGIYRAPKTHDLKEYWKFCKEHVAEYNKNWNYFANMTPEEVEAEWERETFGTADKDAEKNNKRNEEYIKFIDDFINGRCNNQTSTPQKNVSSHILSALKVFDLPISANWNDISKKYRILAKKYHPDTSKNINTSKFTELTNAYETLKKHFGK